MQKYLFLLLGIVGLKFVMIIRLLGWRLGMRILMELRNMFSSLLDHPLKDKVILPNTKKPEN
jgi:hypothetical protein